ncbi:sensor histidine kinase [Flavitalea flava]
MTIKPYLNDHGARQSVSKVLYTDKRITIQHLKILNELYRFVTEVTNDCLWEWDFKERQLFWIDEGHKRLFGYPIENAFIPQRFWEDHIHDDDRNRVLNKLSKIISEGSSSTWEDEYRFEKASGDYVFVHDRGHIVYDGNKKALRMIGATQDITARKSVEFQLLESERKLSYERLNRQKEIASSVLAAQEKERSEIGEELHDNLNQILGATKLYIELAKTDEENRDMLLEKSSEYIVTVIEEIRRISKTLTYPGPHLMGLSDSIKILLDEYKMVHPLKIEYRMEVLDEKELSEKLQLDIFRIIQEQLNNILKHAKASLATISLTRHKNEIRLLISDNGEGADLSAEKKGVGIQNIMNRARLHQGSVKTVSTPGEGYQLKVTLLLHPGSPDFPVSVN